MKKFILFLSILGFVACNNRLPEDDEIQPLLGTEVKDTVKKDTSIIVKPEQCVK